jgi:hypothetical protein
LNSSIKQYIFKRTSRGGGGQSIAKALHRWSLRRLLIWLYPDLQELKALLDQQREELKKEKRIEKQKLNLQQEKENDSDDRDGIDDRDNNDVIDEVLVDDQDFAIS